MLEVLTIIFFGMSVDVSKQREGLQSESCKKPTYSDYSMVDILGTISYVRYLATQNN